MASRPPSSFLITPFLPLPRPQAFKAAPLHLNPNRDRHTSSAPARHSQDTASRSASGSSDSYRAAGQLTGGRWGCSSFTGRTLNSQNRRSDKEEEEGEEEEVEKPVWEVFQDMEPNSGCHNHVRKDWSRDRQHCRRSFLFSIHDTQM